MNLLDILKAQRKSGKPPTIKGRRWKVKEQERMSQGLCVVCGDQPAQTLSYLCASCEGQDSLEDIRSEIQHLRARILYK